MSQIKVTLKPILKLTKSMKYIKIIIVMVMGFKNI